MKNKIINYILGKFFEITRNLIMPNDCPVVKQVEVEGQKILVLANEIVGSHIYFMRNFEMKDKLALIKRVRPDDVCLDIGANVGYYTILMAKAAHNGEVHSFEPIPLNYHLLSASVQINRYKHVVVNQLAIGNKNTMTDFTETIDSAFSSIKPTGRMSEINNFEVMMRTVDDYVHKSKLNKVDVIKVDIEGAENLFLQGAKSLLVSRKKPRLIMLELFDENLQAFGNTIDDLVDNLAEVGYSPFKACRNGELKPFNKQDYNKEVNVFFMPDLGMQ